MLGPVALAEGTARAKPGPDLRVSALSAPPGPIAAGATFAVRPTTRNAGSRQAKRSSTRLYLSRDGRRSRDDVRVGAAKVPVLRARTSRRARAAATVPAGAGAARYRLLACADDTRKVRERNERNNCRAARRALTVVARTPAGGVRSPAPWT